MIGEPRIDERAARPTLGIRATVPMTELPMVIPRSIGEVHGWLEQNRIRPAGAPFVRYYVINMPGNLEIEVGWPVESASATSDRVQAGAIPAGRYASLVYTGNYPGLPDATRALLDWGAAKGLVWDATTTPAGDRFGARLETYWTNPAEEPDLNKHET